MNSKYSRIKDLPKFIMIMINGRKGSAMRLINKGDPEFGRWMYWRDAGLWGIDVRMENGKLVSDARMYGDDLQYLDGNEIVPITEEEWKKDNQGYV